MGNHCVGVTFGVPPLITGKGPWTVVLPVVVTRDRN